MRGVFVTVACVFLLAACAAAGGPSSVFGHGAGAVGMPASGSEALSSSPTPAGHLYVLAYQTYQPNNFPTPTPTPAVISVYSVNDSGTHPARRLIAGTNTLLGVGAQQIAADRFGDVYVTCHQCLTNMLGSQSELLQFAPKANGDAAPEVSIELAFPFGVSTDSHGNPYVFDGAQTSFIYEFPIGPGGGTYRQINGSNTRLGGVPEYLTVDHAGRIYSDSGGYFTEFAATASGNVAPIAFFLDGRGLMGHTVVDYGLAVDRANDLYTVATVDGVPEVDEFSRKSSGPVTPTVILSGSMTQLYQPDSIAIDNAGRIYVGNCAMNCPLPYPDVTVYAAGATGNVAPVSVLDIPWSGIASIAIGK